MVDQSASARFQVLFESACQAYEKKTGVSLTQHQLAMDFDRCQSVEGFNTLLQGRAQVFSDFRARNRMLRSIEIIGSILTPLSGTASLSETMGLTLVPHVKVIYGVLYILLGAANGVITNCDVLADLVESIERFINRLQSYTLIPPTSPMNHVLIDCAMELISTLVGVTDKLKRRRSLKRVRNFFGVKDIKKARQRLDRLILEEIPTTTAHTNDSHDERMMKKSMDDRKASTGTARKVPDQMTSDVDQSKRDVLRKNIHKWLSPPDPWINYNFACKSRHGNTGDWFIKGDTLSKWKESGPSSLLWIYGKPGAGKSVICSTVIKDIENMRKSRRASLAMFYYTFAEDQKKDLRGLLSSVLFQLYDQSDSYYNIFSNFYSTHCDGTQSPSDDDLAGFLKALLRNPGPLPIYLIIDGIDECPSASGLWSPREEVLSLLEELVEENFTNLRICVTSRPEIDIQIILEPLAFCSVSLHNQPGQIEDIEKYIESFVNKDGNMQNWTPECRKLVINVLTRKADGMFRWADCQLKYLAGCDPANIQQALDTLPESLDETYERTLRGINQAKWKSARRLLLCVAAAQRLLRVEELAEILVFDFEAGPIPRFHEDWRLKNPVQAVLSTCSTLLSVVEDLGSQVIRFAHFSVKEFLTSARFAENDNIISRRYYISMTPAHTLVTQACLGMLLHLDKNIIKHDLQKYPLAQYAAKNWLEHAHFEGVSQNVYEGMKQLFDLRKYHLAVWLWICDPTVSLWPQEQLAERPLPPRGTPLHYAAFCGLHDIVKVLTIEYPQDIKSRSFNEDSTPLHLASKEGHVEPARLLIECGADVSALDKDGRTPLHWASRYGHVVLAQLLIEHGADTAARMDDGSTPLHWASEKGHVELARLLVEHGADAAARAKDWWTPLYWASLKGHVELARLLVEHGADTAARTDDGSTPLHWASSNGNVKLAQLLVEHGANTAARTEDGWTPLHGASSSGDVELTQLLIEHGADMAARTDYGWTPLHGASRYGHVELARLLVEHGTDTAARTDDGSTPLHEASRNDHVGLARLLVDHDADTAARTKDGSTPLHWASENGHVELTRLLVEHGADTAARKKDGSTPLHWALRYGHVEVARLLVDHGADTAVRTEHGSTPLHWASSNGDVGLARFLVEHGADGTSQTKGGSTPPHEGSPKRPCGAGAAPRRVRC